MLRLLLMFELRMTDLTAAATGTVDGSVAAAMGEGSAVLVGVEVEEYIRSIATTDIVPMVQIVAALAAFDGLDDDLLSTLVTHHSAQVSPSAAARTVLHVI